MEKIRISNFRGRIWKSSSSYVITVPMGEVRNGKFREGQTVEATIQTVV